MAVETLPDHMEKAGEWGGFVGEYMTSNDIEPLSDEEKKKVAMADGATEEETDEMFK